MVSTDRTLQQRHLTSTSNSNGDIKPIPLIKDNNEKQLLMLSDVPDYLQFNPYIYTGYRPLLSLWGCVQSVWCFHNETVNILTHGIPIAFIIWQIPTMLPWEELNLPLGWALPASHVAATLSPWIGSVVYHVFMNHHKGKNLYKRLLQLDMLGIWVTQSFGALTTIWAASFCLSPIIQAFLLIFYSALSARGLFKALTAWSPWDRRFCFVFPLLMRICMFMLRLTPIGGGHPHALTHVVLQDLVSVVGGVIGAMRIPEKWLPGYLDKLGNSHHLMHILVVQAVLHMHLATSNDLIWMSQDQACSTYY